MYRKHLFLICLVLLASTFFLSGELLAQCPMCRIAAESNLQNGGSAGKGLNQGIVYMLATPYLLVAVFGYVWWKNRKREEEMEKGPDSH